MVSGLQGTGIDGEGNRIDKTPKIETEEIERRFS